MVLNKNQMNILNAYSLATYEDIEEGMLWYLKTRNMCKTIAKKTNVSFIKVAGIFAALSPACPIDKNISDTLDLIINEDHRCTTYGNNVKKALTILKLQRPTIHDILKILNGQKTTRFFLNIYSPRFDVVTIDRHAISIYFGTFDHGFKQTKNRIHKIREDYKEVAKFLNIRPYQLQAITWVVWKRINNI